MLQSGFARRRCIDVSERRPEQLPEAPTVASGLDYRGSGFGALGRFVGRETPRPLMRETGAPMAPDCQGIPDGTRPSTSKPPAAPTSTARWPWGSRTGPTEAVKWYRKAAEQGYVMAQYNLGVMYALGQGVPPDYVEAYAWSLLAEENMPGDEAVAARVRAATAHFTSPADLARGRERADELRRLVKENRRRSRQSEEAERTAPIQ